MEDECSVLAVRFSYRGVAISKKNREERLGRLGRHVDEDNVEDGCILRNCFSHWQ